MVWEGTNPAAGSGEYRRYIGGVAIATYFAASGIDRVRFLHTDHLGSTVAISTETGQVETELGFDAWGQRRPGDWNQSPWQQWLNPLTPAWASTALAITPRGYTGHEHVDAMGIIHMNGRIYDPHLGRFLQADPFVEDTTTLNRYTYVHNNPLSLTDPSGFFSFGKFFRTIAAVAITAYAPGVLTPLLGKLGAIVASGALAGFVATGSVEGALIGAFTAGAFHGIGTGFESLADKFPSGIGGSFLGSDFSALGLALKSVAHGLTGGVFSSVQGGKFVHGFSAAGVTQFASGGIDLIDPSTSFSPLRIAAAAVLGGTVSEISGGKFANGAVTGAFSRAFNDEPLEDESIEDSVSAGLSVELHERLRAGILVERGDARLVFRLPIGEEFSLVVNEDGIGKLTVGGNDLIVNDKRLVDGAGVNIRAISIVGRALDSGKVTFTGRVSIPLFANRVGLSLGITRSIDIESAVLNNSGGLGQAARALTNRTNRLDRAICEQSGSGDC